MAGYETFKFLHVLGTVLLIGNVTVTAVWKVFADRTRNPVTIQFAQRLVTLTDWSFTASGIILIVAGGYGMAIAGGMNLVRTPWLLWGQILFAVSGCIWLFALVPIQVKQSRLARSFSDGARIPEEYWRLGRRWLVLGIVATVPLVAALFVMIAKRT